MTECLQDKFGPTPCFREAVLTRSTDEVLPCSLEICPIIKHMEQDPDLSGWKAVHHYCVITHPHDYLGELKSIQLALIANNKNS